MSELFFAVIAGSPHTWHDSLSDYSGFENVLSAVQKHIFC